MARTRVTINKAAIAKMMREMQAEFDKHPIRVPVAADAKLPAPVTNYNGPTVIVSGDGAQIERIEQNHQITQTVAPGFEQLAIVVTELLKRLDNLPLSQDDRDVAREAGDQIVSEVAKSEPNQGSLVRGKKLLIGVLAPLIIAAQSGLDDGVREWVKTVIEHLTGTAT